nr:hypothetical protein [Moraxella sp. CTOTU46934]
MTDFSNQDCERGAALSGWLVWVGSLLLLAVLGVLGLVWVFPVLVASFC